MLTTQGETSEASILGRISAARGNSEPAPEPTEEPSAVNVSEEAEVEEPEVAEVIEAEAEQAPLEESEEAEASAQEGDAEELYVDLGDREISLSDIKEWEQGHLRQSDYTRKTTELAEQRKAFEADREAFDTQQQKMQSQIATLEAIISDEEQSPEALAEMREYDPDAYIKYQERQAKLKEAVNGSKSITPVAAEVDFQKESAALFDANPDWTKDGKQTEAFAQDMKMVGEYAKKRGFTDEEVNGITSARQWLLLLDAARGQQAGNKAAAITKKVRKAPVSTKPRKAAVAGLDDQIKKAQARLKQTGKAEDAVKLRQLKRQKQA